MDRTGDEGRQDLTSIPDLAGDRPAALPDAADGGAGQLPRRSALVWLLVHLSTLVIAGGVLLWFNRDQWFFGDEWEFIVNRGLVDSRFSIWYPHNEHWSTLPILVYDGLLNTFGLGSYWPYISVLVAVHLLLAHLLWRVMMRAGAAPLIATAAVAVFAVLGAGAENLLWAFQIGFVGSVAFGWAAALVIDRSDELCRRDAWAIVLLIGSLMCSGIGLPAVAMVTLLALMRSRRPWRPLVVGGAPAATFLTWYVLEPQSPKPPVQTAADGGLLSLADYPVASLRDAISASTGLPPILALLVLGAVGVWTVITTIAIVRRRPAGAERAIAVVGLYGAVGFFVLSGFGRGGDVTAPRYVYVALALALPGLTLAMSRLARPIWAQRLMAATLTLILAINVTTLRDRSHLEADREQQAKHAIIAAEWLVANGEPIVGDKPDPTYNPDITVESLPWLVAKGLPMDELTPEGLAGARLGLQIHIDGQDANSPGGTPPGIADQGGLSLSNASPPNAGVPCIRLTATGSDPHLILTASGDLSTISVSSAVGGLFALALQANLVAGQQVAGLDAGETRFIKTSLPTGTPIRLTLAMPESVVCGVR